MTIMTTKQLSAKISSIGKSAEKFAGDVQEALIHCGFYVMKDGNTTPLNQLLDAVGTGTRLKGLTTWAELFLPVRIKDERFVVNKHAAKEQRVSNEDEYAEYRAAMEAAPRWDKIVGKEKPESIWDSGKYLARVIKKLSDEGDAELAEAIKAAELAYRIRQNAVLPKVPASEAA